MVLRSSVRLIATAPSNWTGREARLRLIDDALVVLFRGDGGVANSFNHAGVGEGGGVAEGAAVAMSRSRRRMILPERVFGRSA